MKKSLLFAALFSFVASASAQTLVTNDNIATEIADGKIIALQCKDTNGGYDTYFNGATTKSSTLQFSNLFLVVAVEDDTNGAFYLQRLTDSSYVGNNSNAVTAETEVSSAAQFTAAIATPTGWSSKPGEIVGGTNTVRFTNGSVYLNTQDQAGTPKYYAGTGGYSIWYVYSFTVDEAVAVAKSGMSNELAGFESMNAIIDNESAPTLEFDVTVTDNDPLQIYSAVQTAYESASASETYIAACSEYINKFNGKLVSIKNYRRANTDGQTPYLARYIQSGSVVTNTLSEVTNDAVWQMSIDSNNYITFYSLTTGGGSIGTIIPEAATNGTYLKYTNPSNSEKPYMNMDISSNNLTVYSADAGSVWVVEATEYDFAEPETTTAESPKYYRIVSDGWMSAHASPQIAVNGETRTTATGEGESASRAGYFHLGAFWRLESGVSENSVKLVNLVDEYALTANGTSAATMTDAGTEFYLHALTDNNYTIANTYAISTAATYSTENNLSCSGTTLVLGTNAETANLDTNNALWYFIEASEDEIALATTNYISTVSASVGSFVDDEDNLTALLGEIEDYAKVADAFGKCTTIAAVNDFKRNGTISSSDVTALNSTILTTAQTAVVGQVVQLRGREESFGYIYDNGTKLAMSTDPTDATTLWTIAAGDNENTLTFQNVSTGRYISTVTKSTQVATSDETPVEFYLAEYSVAYGGFGIDTYGQTDGYLAIHYTTDKGPVGWGYSAANSHWSIRALEDATSEIETSSTNNTLTITLPAAPSSYATDNSLCITISAATSTVVAYDTESSSSDITISASDFNSSTTATVSKTLSAGTYKVTIPTGFIVTSGGSLNRETVSTITVDADGNTTGIAEVEATNADNVIYNLQGRRVVNASNGIYIINGKKVLVK